MENNITPHKFQVSVQNRREINQHQSFVIWFTGLSGSGKSTIANAVEKELFSKGIKTYCLDGDNIRRGINKNLSFSPEDRTENIRRIGEICALMVDAGLIVLASFVSPYKKDRDRVRAIVKGANFVEVYISTSIEECERRDTKGLYVKARAGEVENMTGISAPYEAPEKPDVTIDTEFESIEDSAQKIIAFITSKLQLKK